MKRILSLGAGVQSSTVLQMSCLGVLPKLDAAIFSDTEWEPRAVYLYLGWLERFAADHGVPVYRVGKGNLREDLLTLYPGCGKQAPSIPLYTLSKNGELGAVKRTCTKVYKVIPVEKKIRELLGLKPRQPWPKEPVVDLWFGISVDELRRVRMPDRRWKAHRYPLIYDLPRAFRRADCLRWQEEHGFPTAPRSACIGCPFRSNVEWRRIQDVPEEWEDAVRFDHAIRHKRGLRGTGYLHRDGVPLDEADLSTAEERGQLTFDGECMGYCGV